MIIAYISLIVLIIAATTIRVFMLKKKKDKYDLSNPEIEKLVHEYIYTNMTPSEYHEKFEEIKKKTEFKELRLEKLKRLENIKKLDKWKAMLKH